jgi:hypothetical protein
LDSTHNLAAHFPPIRIEVDRNCVPLTHGIFRGSTEIELYVAVHVEANEQPSALDRKLVHLRGLERPVGARSAGSEAASLLSILSKCNNNK